MLAILFYNLLFRWFLDMDMAEESIDHSTFSRNRARLLEHDVAAKFLAEIVAMARGATLMSDDDTHESTTDPEAKLARKGNDQPAKLSYLANAMMDNRNGLVVDLRVKPATGFAEREGALAMLDQHVAGREGATLGADAGYDVAGLVAALRQRGITPHIAQTREDRRRSAVDSRTTRYSGYPVSQRIRKRVEEIFGWTKTVACFRKTRFKGRVRTQLAAHLVAAAYNLFGLRN